MSEFLPLRRQPFSRKTIAVRLSIAALLVAGSPGVTLAQGVPYGSDKQAFIDALADMEPVEMVMQSVGSPGDNSSRVQEAYAAAIEEWSGGKIETEIVYGSAIMQGNTAPAIADGRLTHGGVIALYDPSNFPASAALIDLSLLSNASPFAGILQSYGMMLEAGNSSEQAWEEQRDYGVEPGYIASGAPPSGFFCREPRTSLEDFAGVQTRTGGVMHAREIEGLGAANVSLPYSEMFEGLQRGIIDCALTSLATARVTGLIEVGPYYTASSESGFALTATNSGWDIYFWEDLPLAARQLLYDLQTVYLEQQIRSSLEGSKLALEQISEVGGEVLELEADASQRLREVNLALVEEFRSNPYLDNADEMVGRFLEASAKWEAIVGELGYADMDPGWAGFATWYDDESVDLSAFIDRLYEETMLPYRPE